MPLRTEVKFCLKENLSKIPTRDDLNLTTLSNLKLVLVDHHVLQTQDLNLLPYTMSTHICIYTNFDEINEN